jgi:sulfur-oxidizing protein SoxX
MTTPPAALLLALTTLFVVAPLSASAQAIRLGAQPLTDVPGDAQRGRAIVTDRQVGLCLLCHSGTFPDQAFMGNLAPSLDGAGSRSTDAQLRLRLMDARRINPETIMPPYFSTENLHRVAPEFKGKTLLSAQQIEDVVAFLRQLKE